MKYNKITPEGVAYLSSIVGCAYVTTDNIAPEFLKDELGTISGTPDVVVKPRTANEISKIAKYAHDNHIPLTVRGGGTGLVGACVAIHGGILLEMSRMNRIIGIDENNLVLEVEPGVLVMDIYDYVESRGYFYPPDPGEKSAMIGGNVATNAGGMRAVKYGVTRDWVAAIEVVLPNGAKEQFGRVVAKNSTGYSLKDLVIGSEGTLAIITKLYLKLIALPANSISLLVPFNDLPTAIKSVPEILKAKLAPTAIEFFTKDTIGFSESYLGKKFPDQNYPAYILLTFDGVSEREVIEHYQEGADLMLDKLGARDALIVDTAERKEDVWNARGAFLEAIKASTTEMDECDVVVPRDKIADFILFTTELSKQHGMRIPSFGHAGDGNLHIYLCRDDLDEATWQEKLTVLFDELYKKADEFGGLASGEHGIGYAKKDYMAKMLGPEQMRLMRGIKQVFDPHNILNPGKVV